jgi:hypothetical protein
MYGQAMITKIAILTIESLAAAILSVYLAQRWRPEAMIALGALLTGAAAFLLPGVAH